MFRKWRINRLKRKVHVLTCRLNNLNSLKYYSGTCIYDAMDVADKLSAVKFDLERLEDKS